MHELQPNYTFHDGVNAIREGIPVSTAAKTLLCALTRSERLWLLDGDESFWKGMKSIFTDRYNRTPYVMGEVKRLGIPGVRFTDGPRGVVMCDSTAFPVAMARGATWDIDLERRIGHAIGKEARAQGANYFAGVCVNLPRHPAWGRIQETYSDDPLLLGEFGLALAQGVQEQDVMACVKHFALNSMENARFQVDVNIAENVLHEVYLPHFRKIIEGGTASVMSAYNSVRGEWCGQNRELLTEILREKWNFDGFVISDFIFGLRDAPLSVKNGLDIEAPFRQQRAMHLKTALESNQLDWADVDRACLRILSKQLEFEAKTSNPMPDKSVIFSDEHRALAREAAQRSMVLLKNNSVDDKSLLPLKSEGISNIAIVGRLANIANTGDHGSSRVFSPQIITPFEGLQSALPHAKIQLDDSDSVERAKELAAHSEIAICIVGYNHQDEGEYITPSKDSGLKSLFPPPTVEDGDVSTIVATMTGQKEISHVSDDLSSSIKAGSGGDRKSLRLRKEDVDILEAVASVNPKTIVVMIAAGAVIIEEWKDKVPAIVMGWYSGSEGGHALADVLLGYTNVSGRLPFSVPKSEEHLPPFDMNAKKTTYDRWHGQHLLDKLGVEAAYPFGFGLSYTTFTISDLQIGQTDVDLETVDISVVVTNTGNREGRYIAQIYGLTDQADFPKRVLLGYMPADLAAGEAQALKLKASLRPLQRWIDGKFILLREEIKVEVAGYSGDAAALQSRLHL